MVDKNPRKEMNRLQGENRKREVYPDDEATFSGRILGIPLEKLRESPIEFITFFGGLEDIPPRFKRFYSSKRLVTAYGRYCGRMREYRLIQEFMEARHGKDKLSQDSNSLSTRP